MAVYVNGVKQVADEFGSVDLSATDGATNDIGLWHGMESGLAISTNYDVDINVDGGGFTTYTVDGTNCFRLGNLIDELNNVSGGAFSAKMYDGTIHFFSNTSGTGSSIDVAAGSGANADLIASIVGNAGTTGTIDIDLGDNEYNPTTPTDYAYKETGLVGFESQEFEFNSPLPLGSVIEVIIEVDMFNRE